MPEDPPLEEGPVPQGDSGTGSRAWAPAGSKEPRASAGRGGARRAPSAARRRPQVFSIAVFGPILNEGYVNADSGPELRCVFNANAGACRFGVALGLGAFLACAAFLLLDARFQQISSVRDRRRAVLLDLGFSGGQGRGARGGRRRGALAAAAPPAPRVTRPPVRRALVLPVVRGLLLPHQPVAAHGARARHSAGGRRGAGRHSLQLLLHL